MSPKPAKPPHPRACRVLGWVWTRGPNCPECGAEGRRDGDMILHPSWVDTPALTGEPDEAASKGGEQRKEAP